MISVLFCDASQIIRKSFRRLMEFEKNIVIVGEAETFSDTVRLTNELKPNVVVLDCQMPEDKAVSPSQIKEFFGTVESRLVAISAFIDDKTKRLAESFGAKSLVDKAHLVSELVPAIRVAATK
ncbi:MAG TPA: response regulator [Candidatus Saccharimonadales bacterium]|nr:response regulator [Candidatus Saccharimonadales bacterium]